MPTHKSVDVRAVTEAASKVVGRDALLDVLTRFSDDKEKVDEAVENIVDGGGIQTAVRNLPAREVSSGFFSNTTMIALFGLGIAAIFLIAKKRKK